jgi:hypothetical protein
LAALHEVRTAANVAVSHTVGLRISDHSCAGRPGAIAQDVRIARLFRKVLIEGQTDLTPTTMKGPDPLRFRRDRLAYATPLARSASR